MRVGIGRIERLLHQVDKSVAYVVLEAKIFEYNRVLRQTLELLVLI